MLNTLTSFETLLDAKKKLPTVLTVARLEAKNPPNELLPPVKKGDPGTGVSVPSAATEKPETVLGPLT